MYPRLIINRKKFENNLSIVSKTLAGSGISFTFVTKCFLAHPSLCEIALPYIDHFGDSRLMNLDKLPNCKPRVLLRLPMISEASDVVRCADISLNSELETVKALNTAAKEQGRVHSVILMADFGDLREGYYSSTEMLEDTAIIEKMEHIKIIGIGVNLSCYGGVIPKLEHMERLNDLAEEFESLIGRELDIISGGNSSSLKFVFEGTMPYGINNLRIGDSILSGTDPTVGVPLPGMHSDVFTFAAEVIEVKEKPSIPEGERGLDAFGEQNHILDLGVRKRAILAAGRQDIDPKGITPINPAYTVLGASSDHLLVDVHNGRESLSVGDRIKFNCSYSAILRAFTSHYVVKEILE
ncbi:MAG: alanine/ornithine racemase family PLP-dependent enzyme [Defluviitaleaceae bacterium]|nr:alanine/ornithine racemase family PLP-dependent enzyme [Defluviitaleaceae bacterium]